MGAGQGAGAAAVVAAIAGAVLLAGPAQASGAYDPVLAEQAVPADPCAIPPGGEPPLMCQSGVAEEVEPAPAPTSDDRTGLLSAVGAGVVLAGAGAVVLARRRRASVPAS